MVVLACATDLQLLSFLRNSSILKIHFCSVVVNFLKNIISFFLHVALKSFIEHKTLLASLRGMVSHNCMPFMLYYAI